MGPLAIRCQGMLHMSACASMRGAAICMYLCIDDMKLALRRALQPVCPRVCSCQQAREAARPERQSRCWQ